VPSGSSRPRAIVHARQACRDKRKAALLSGPAVPPLPLAVVGVGELLHQLLVRVAAAVRPPADLAAAREVLAAAGAVGYLLDRLPEGLRLVLATRSDPPLRLGRRRALGPASVMAARCAGFGAARSRGTGYCRRTG
jgi:LuxR family maltose regulon positive regulatory protein